MKPYYEYRLADVCKISNCNAPGLMFQCKLVLFGGEDASVTSSQLYSHAQKGERECIKPGREHVNT